MSQPESPWLLNYSRESKNTCTAVQKNFFSDGVHSTGQVHTSAQQSLSGKICDYLQFIIELLALSLIMSHTNNR